MTLERLDPAMVTGRRVVTHEGVRIHFRDHGGPGDTPLVLLHGLTANAWCFEGLVGAGLAKVRRTISIDLRGRGESDKPAAGYSMADHAADVLLVIDALGAKGAVPFGHSFGGLLAMYLASRHPGRFERLIVADAAGPAVQNPATMQLIGPSLLRLGKVSASLAAFLDEMRRMPFLEGRWYPELEAYYRADVEVRDDGTVTTRSTPAVIAQVIERVKEEDWAAHIRGVHQPTLFLHALGGYGPPGTPPVILEEQAAEMKRDLRDCRYFSVPGNHMTMLFGEGAEQVVGRVASFLGG
ncbi:MAG: alpha/beta fold hydrolase [Polyangiaceae bacterium]